MAHWFKEGTMADEAPNVEILKAAYKRWSDSKGASVDDWMKICDTNIAFGSLAQGAAPPIQYMTAYSKRDLLKDYFGGLARDWDMIESITDHFIAQGDRVVVVGRCSWRFKKSGKVVSTPKCDVWRMKDGKAVEFFEYYDTAQVMAAAVPGVAAAFAAAVSPGAAQA
jgi:ketosteroid isomerase-like protein